MLSLSLMLALGVQRTSVDSSGFGGGSGTPPPLPPLGMAMLALPKGSAHMWVFGGGSCIKAICFMTMRQLKGLIGTAGCGYLYIIIHTENSYTYLS